MAGGGKISAGEWRENDALGVTQKTVWGLSARLAKLEKVSADAVRDDLIREGAQIWTEGLLEELKPGAPCVKCRRGKRARWAFLLFAKAAKLVGAEPALLIMLLQRMGVPRIEDLDALVEDGKRFRTLKDASGTSLEHYRDSGVELLQKVLREKPEWRSLVLTAIATGGGPRVLPAHEESKAVEEGEAEPVIAQVTPLAAE